MAVKTKEKRPVLYWSETAVWFDDGKGTWRDLGVMTRGDAGKFCFLHCARFTKIHDTGRPYDQRASNRAVRARTIEPTN